LQHEAKVKEPKLWKLEQLLNRVPDCPVAVSKEYTSSPKQAGDDKLCAEVMATIAQHLLCYSVLIAPSNAVLSCVATCENTSPTVSMLSST